MDDKVKITFDKEYKIRIMDPVKFSRSEELDQECGAFIEKITSFNDKINSLVEVLEVHASRIDQQKLRAIGLRMACENESDSRSQKERALKIQINEKRAELDRLMMQFQSLERIEAEQNVQLEKLNCIQK